MGARGPVGKRPDLKHGHRSRAERAGFDELEPMPVQWPEPGGHWHPAAARWYASLAESAQAEYYQQSDAALAWVTAENLSRHLHDDKPMSGLALSAFLSANTDLLASAGARRRVRLELGRPDDAIGSAHIAAVESIGARRTSGNNGA